MKKILAAMLLTGFLAMPAIGLAVSTAPNVNITTALNNVTNWAFGLILVVAAMFMIFGAFTYITASGDPEKIKTAHNSIMYALIGVAVAVMARGLVTLVQKMLGV